ncbi:HAMP domain-containing histidine kinase [Litorilinea aerophila]|uniref:histidine kinase n=1 Tax=Litorilinea aerophila TaxID=1204385 RepID=A0A540VG21_9CHLR|nr:HAMP domain-containing sensor histidine kinase [Litorilinea aerophila]MCC9077219.1 HAMP domain-containing histidine kinase [Litorilinea aerophila]OUC06305.1 hypothetical protein RY27_21925 [Litorilinea aerophila]
MNTLRRRFILSHTLPLLLVTPLMALVLIYVLERQILLINLSTQLERQATVLAEVLQDSPDLWSEAGLAQSFVNRFSRHLTANLSLLRPDGTILASSDTGEARPSASGSSEVNVELLQLGKRQVMVNYSQNPGEEIVEVIVPVFQPGGVVGAIHLTQRLGPVYPRFQRLRTFVFWALLPGLFLGVLIGLVLAHFVEAPMQELSQQIGRMASGDALVALPEPQPTELRTLVRTFNSLVDRLQTLEASRRQLVANLVHEIGRPLGALRSAVDALQGGAGAAPERRKALLAGVDTELQHLEQLLEELAEVYARKENELRRLQLRSTRLTDWLGTVLAPWEEAARRKGISWQVHQPASLPTVTIDPVRLGQALGNLLSNAVKYTPPGGAIAVIVHSERDMVNIQVRDTGPGIPSAEQDRIFEPFYRWPSEHHYQPGMGLGLAIAREWVRAHGGQIQVESTPGHGSTFTISLPLT